MDVEAGTKLGAQCCHVQAAHDPVVGMALYEELSSKKMMRKFSNVFHKHGCSKLHV